MKLRIYLFTASCFLVAGGTAPAKEPLLVPASQFDARTILHTPPANDSEITAGELAELHRIEAGRTKAEFDKAAADGKDESVFLFRNVFGDGFAADRLPATAAFFAKVGNDEGFHAAIAKNQWRRPRPIAVDANIHPCGPGKSFSYPSGHATRAYVLGIVLASVVPAKRDAILERAADYARSRLICGVHYPSDVEAGRLVGTALAAVMLSSPRVQRELEPVRTELKAAGLVSNL